MMVVVAIAIALVLIILWFILQPQQGQIASNAPRKSSAALPQGNIDPDQEVRQLLRQGQKLDAIKRVRHITGWGLKEAKEYVEALPEAPSLTTL